MVALSPIEAEYVATTLSACQTGWLREILSDLGQDQDEATKVYCDKKSSLLLAINHVYHNRIIHIEIKHHYIRELITKEEVKLESCGIAKQLSNLMTNSMPLKKHEDVCIKLGFSKFK